MYRGGGCLGSPGARDMQGVQPGTQGRRMDIGSRNWLSDMRSQHGADYRVEVELSDRLRNAPTTERGNSMARCTRSCTNVCRIILS